MLIYKKKNYILSVIYSQSGLSIGLRGHFYKGNGRSSDIYEVGM